jgi:hypothetical protein
MALLTPGFNTAFKDREGLEALRREQKACLLRATATAADKDDWAAAIPGVACSGKSSERDQLRAFDISSGIFGVLSNVDPSDTHLVADLNT